MYVKYNQPPLTLAKNVGHNKTDTSSPLGQGLRLKLAGFLIVKSVYTSGFDALSILSLFVYTRLCLFTQVPSI